MLAVGTFLAIASIAVSAVASIDQAIKHDPNRKK